MSDVRDPTTESGGTTDAPPRVVLDGVPPPRPLLRRLVRWALFLAILAVNAAVVAGIAGYLYFSRGLPEIPKISDYRPPIVTEMVSADGQIAGEFFAERRKVVPYERIPKRLVQAFVASEDQDFFEHGGVDWTGTIRAAVNTYVLRRRIQGGSSITQQTAKALLISAEGFESGTRRNLARKLKEFILAKRLERAFTKEEILWMYLNGVYLGHHSYGVQAAAENYYRKNVEDLTLEEAALIAGLPQAPSRYSPFSHPEAAKERRRYVLRRMTEEGFISKEDRARASEAEVKVFGVDDVFREIAPFYVEHARRHVVERYGNDRLLQEGLRVELAMDLEKQRAAQAAMLSGPHGGRSPPGLRRPGRERLGPGAEGARRAPRARLAEGDARGGRVLRRDRGAGGQPLRGGGGRGGREPGAPPHLRHALGAPAEPGGLLPRRAHRPSVHRREGGGRRPAPPRRRGSSCRSATRISGWAGRPRCRRRSCCSRSSRTPRLQGALVVGGPVDRLRGRDGGRLRLRRLRVQPRVPGLPPAGHRRSSRIVYAAAIEKLDFTPATILTDAPIVFRDDENSWKPQNYGQDFKGDVTLRTALVNSMNIPAVKTAEALSAKFGMLTLAQWAKGLGLTTPVKLELGTALGSSCVNLWELTNVYALFARYGEKRPATFVKRVLDRDGNVLEDRTDWRDPWVGLDARLAAGFAEVTRPRERAMDERTAYIMVRLMREVATVGTGARAAALGKPAAGKTGTTNDSFDTWFMGFTARPRDRRVAGLRRERDAARARTRPAATPRCRSGSPTCAPRSRLALSRSSPRPPASST